MTQLIIDGDEFETIDGFYSYMISLFPGKKEYF